MAMIDFEREIGFDEVELHPLRRPRFIVSRRRAALFVVLGYFVIVAFAALLFASLEQVQHYNDYRNIQVAQIFAVAMAVPFGVALFMLSRRTRPPRRPG